MDLLSQLMQSLGQQPQQQAKRPQPRQAPAPRPQPAVARGMTPSQRDFPGRTNYGVPQDNMIDTEFGYMTPEQYDGMSADNMATNRMVQNGQLPQSQMEVYPQRPQARSQQQDPLAQLRQLLGF